MTTDELKQQGIDIWLACKTDPLELWGWRPAKDGQREQGFWCFPEETGDEWIFIRSTQRLSLMLSDPSMVFSRAPWQLKPKDPDLLLDEGL